MQTCRLRAGTQSAFPVCLRCDFLPECYMDSTEIRERRRTLRYRSLLVRQVVQLKTRLASLLMETGVSYDRQQLHRLGFVSELLASEDVIKSIRPLLRVSQDSILRLRRIESALIRSLERDPLLAERVRRLQTVPCVGRITALTWALEMGDISRLRSIRQAISYCGLWGDEQNPPTRQCAHRFPYCLSPMLSSGGPIEFIHYVSTLRTSPMLNLKSDARSVSRSLAYGHEFHTLQVTHRDTVAIYRDPARSVPGETFIVAGNDDPSVQPILTKFYSHAMHIILPSTRPLASRPLSPSLPSISSVESE